MKLLLDTHVFLWFISGDQRLASTHRNAISNPAHQVFLSAAALWEAIVEYQIGKLPLPKAPGTYLPAERKRHGIAPLPIDELSVSRLSSLPHHHRDPFDRIMICQALEHGLTLLTVDPLVLRYAVPTLAP